MSGDSYLNDSKKKAGKVTVEHASDAVTEIFETTGFDQMIDVR
jgi:hypothetical protein